MEFPTIVYPPQVVQQFASILASNDPGSVNYLKGPQLVQLFQNFGFHDNYTFVDGRGIQTSDFGEGLSRLTYTFKRLNKLNTSKQLPKVLKTFIEGSNNPSEAFYSIQNVLSNFNLPLLSFPSMEKLIDKQVWDNTKKLYKKVQGPRLTKPYFVEKFEKTKNLNEAYKSRQFDFEKEMLGEIPEGRPVVFISYSWDSSEHKEWVKNLADDLTSQGIFVLLDQYLRDGIQLVTFMEYGIERADKTLIIGTEEYKKKYYSEDSGVAFEGTVIKSNIFQNIAKTKFIPCLRHGTFQSSFPTIFAGIKGHDFVDDDNYNNELDNLCHDIWGKPQIDRPQIGDIPSYVR